MQIDYARAKQILEEEAAAAPSGPVSEEWTGRIRKLVAACGESNLTFVAALGTAMLAKATNLDVDVTTLKASASERGYSARGLCTNVLAALAPRLAIDLGVTGREPLNNQPFFAEERITESFPVRPAARPALHALLEALAALERVRDETEARLVLRSFLLVRARGEAAGSLLEGAGHGLALIELAAAATKFVQERSEKGKRAQAVTAGFLDVAFGESRVLTERVHDPDRHFPGDVAVRASEWAESDIVRVFEVRDKRVTNEDLHHFASKVLESGIHLAGVVAVAPGQASVDLTDGLTWSATRGLLVVVYPDWLALARDALFWSEGVAADPIATAYRRIYARLEEVEASSAALEAWRSIGR